MTRLAFLALRSAAADAPKAAVIPPTAVPLADMTRITGIAVAPVIAEAAMAIACAALDGVRS